MDYKIKYDNWLSDPRLCKEGSDELISIKDDQKEIEYRFGAELAFGTAGMRGLIGYGTNEINIYTVRRATQGLAEYIKSLGKKAMDRGVAISYDTRKYSDVFAMDAAGVLLYNGIKVHLYKEARPVPMLSFAVREYNAIAGIMITASHNPKEYNGYKVYGEDGAQMSPEATAEVVKYISSITDYFSVELIDIKNKAINHPLLKMIPYSFEKKYYKQIVKLALSKKAVKKQGKKIKIVYTPLHGSGYTPVTTVLKKLGINLEIVQEQIAPDPEFSTVKVPNPENKDSLEMGISLANETNADVVFGTDPDSDRLGVCIRDDKGEFLGLTGNQTGILLLDYVLRRLKEEKNLPSNGVAIKSFVSTGLAKSIADNYGVELVEVPVGFKFIGEKIKQYERDNSHTFLFGFEESCGYLRGTHSRDKDAVVASMLFAEMVCYYTDLGKSVYEVLMGIYDKYGYCVDRTDNVMYSGLTAMDDMNNKLTTMTEKKIDSFGIFNVIAVRNYREGKRYCSDGTETDLDFNDINCLYYELENDSFICLRPSGTEPKMKIYYCIKGKDKEHAEKSLEKVKTAFLSDFEDK